MDYDAFNGDADGICSLIQLRLEEPRPGAMLVTGVKRDIRLLERIDARAGDRVTVLDISMARNAAPLRRILGQGAEVFYADHHDPGEVPEHSALTARIVTRGEMCTAAIVDAWLDGARREWAVVGAYGDNMDAMAERLGEGRDLPLAELRELGRLVNYNAYGASLSDLLYHPDALFTLLLDMQDPREAARSVVIERLREGYASDLADMEAAHVVRQGAGVYAAVLSNTAASRRISGIWANDLASAHPGRAHAVLTHQGDSYQVSLRAPLATRRGAIELAGMFGGGGRAAAAGIDALPHSELDRFLEAFDAAFPSPA